MAKGKKKAEPAATKKTPAPAPSNPGAPISKKPIFQGEPILEWDASPWKVRRKKLSLLLGLFAIMVASIYFLFPEDLYLVILLPIMMVGSNAPHLLPSKFILTTEGIYWKNFISQTYKPWNAFKHHSVYADAVELYYDQTHLRNRLLKGITVYYDDNKEQVVPIVKEMWAKHNQPQQAVSGGQQQA